MIVLIVLGPKRLPGLGRSLGSGLREFKDSIRSRHDDDDDETGRLTSGTDADDQPLDGEVVSERRR